MSTADPQIAIGGLQLDLATWGRGEPSIVFVHDGLGSIRQWRDVPKRTAETTNCGVVAYNRAGHGRSTPVPSAAWPADWMTTEAHVLAALIERSAGGPVRLVGHSDGGSIALLCAALHPELVADVVAIASHAWVEHKCTTAISDLRRVPTAIVSALAPYHANAAALFDAWSGGWTSDEFASWDIRSQLGAIEMPVTLAQGDKDEYATEEMLWSTAAAIGANADPRLLPNCGHAVHREHPELVVRLAADGP